MIDNPNFTTVTTSSYSKASGGMRASSYCDINGANCKTTSEMGGTSVPAGAIMAFNLSSCPSGWTEFTNARGRVVVGKNPSDPSFDSLQETGGEKTHTLTVSEMPQHRHTVFTMVSWGNGNSINPGTGGQGWPGFAGNGMFTDYQGSSSSHNNLQPYISLLYCTKN